VTNDYGSLILIGSFVQLLYREDPAMIVTRELPVIKLLRVSMAFVPHKTSVIELRPANQTCWGWLA
jgi:hypothetical protein